MKKVLPKLVCLSLVLLLGGCAQFSYYHQAMQGQLSLMASAKPVTQWLSDPAVNPDLKLRLQRAQKIRSFAAHELGLPDNASYKSYAELNRKYVMWNVVATPELSMQPKQWCFPVAGCVDYRGYYSKADAERFASGLRQQGYEVRVSGVPAYSTLGWFNDPLLSSFIDYPEAEVARMVFHELAHQTVYAAGDTQFNESFATAVEEIGVARWLEAEGSEAVREDYKIFHQRKADFLQLLAVHANLLKDLYASDLPDQTKRRRKAEIFALLAERYELIKAQQWAGYSGYDRWFAEPLSNAHFVLAATYHELVPAFKALQLTRPGLPQLYAEVRVLAKLSKAERRSRLAQALDASQHPMKAVSLHPVAPQ